MISLERFAELRAAIERGGSRDIVLRQEGMAPTEWIQSQRHWLDALANQVAAGDAALATRYCRAFEAAPSDAPEALPSPTAPAVSVSVSVSIPEPTEPPAIPRAEGMQMPSYLRPALSSPEPSISFAAPPQLLSIKQGTALAFDAPRMAVIPFRAGAPSQVPSSPVRLLDVAQRIPTGTALALDERPRAATPFHSETAAPSAVEPIASAARIGSGTAWAPPSPPLPSGPAMPFQPTDPESLGFSLARYAELVAARDEAGADLTAVLSRFAISPVASSQIEAFWQRRFSENGIFALDFGRHLAQAKKALTERRTARAAVTGGTALALDLPRNLVSLAAPKAPEPPTSEAQAPELSVDQYAWLVAMLRKAAPADLPAVLARVRLTPETRKDLERRWQKRMTDEPAVQQAFLSALARHMGDSAR